MPQPRHMDFHLLIILPYIFFWTLTYSDLNKNKDDQNEMMFQLKTKSKTDKRQVMMMIGENGGRFDSLNKIGESINSLEVGSGGSLDVRVKYENKKQEQSKSIG